MVPWANGLGTTAVVARSPDDDDRWAWRLSLADVVTDGPFSSLPDVDRVIAVASGAGMMLTVGDATPIRLTPMSDAFAFDGAVTTVCHVLDGPVVDINLMTRRGHATGTLEVRHLGAGGALDLDAAVTACVVLSGAVDMGQDNLQRFDAVLQSGADTRVVATEPTRLAVVTVTVNRP